MSVDELDARELDRREKAEQQILAQPENEREAAILEESKRIDTYELTKMSKTTNGGFKCEHAGCKAPPFQTQYLLK